MQNLKSFIYSEQYERLLSSVKEETKIEVNPQEPYLVVMCREAERIKKAGLSYELLLSLLETDFELIFRYTLDWFYKYTGAPCNDEEEYPEGEEPDEDDLPTVIKVLPYNRSFLVSKVVEYGLLKTNPDKFIEYLKAMRIPKAATYGKELKIIYNKVLENHK